MSKGLFVKELHAELIEHWVIIQSIETPVVYSIAFAIKSATVEYHWLKSALYSFVPFPASSQKDKT